jgi:nicotinamidase/pyrazinamidase
MHPQATSLLVVDVQQGFTELCPQELPVPGALAIIPAVNALLALPFARVDATQDWHPEVTPHFAKDGGPWPVHCVAGTWGAELHPGLALPDDAPRVRKGANGEDGYSGFTMRDPATGDEIPTELDARLRDRGIDRVVICGLATDYCVKATAIDAIRLGYAVELLADGVAAVELDPGDGARAIDDMRADGVLVLG